ncbi:unnamed protein product [Paramecium primaurelia]|uniref:Uncharacterized protein n=1 Tax=Paramecium primaurelia TaxID=5886 RepID=A0A8S1K2H3_PARPR|nr:unnamed protein product [Paramecium primaurelia]
MFLYLGLLFNLIKMNQICIETIQYFHLHNEDEENKMIF